MKTYSPKASELTHKWYLVDAKDKVLGRLATEIATRLRGKHKAEFAPHMENGDFVIVINADKIKVTGQKATQKTYYRYTGYVGGLRETTLEEMMAKSPERVIEVDWGTPKNVDKGGPVYPVDVAVEAADRQGLLRDISDVFAREKTNVIGVQTQSVKGTAWMTFTVEVADSGRLNKVLGIVASVSGVRSARRR